MTDDPKSRALAVAEQLRTKPLTDAQRKLAQPLSSRTGLASKPSNVSFFRVVTKAC